MNDTTSGSVAPHQGTRNGVGAVAGRAGRSRLARGLAGSAAARSGTLLLLGFLAVALAAPALAPCPAEQRRYCGEDPYRIPRYGFSSAPHPPGREHWFGTTSKQHDIFYGVVWGARTAFKVGLLITLPALVFGSVLGAASGFRGGWVDEITMRVVEVFMAFPFLLAAIALASVLRTRPELSDGPYPAMLALIAFGWPGYARLIRADVLSVKERDYVWAARGLAVGEGRILIRHVIPNAMFPVLIMASMDIGTYVLSFAGLSFFGLGVPDGYADWGQMLASARNRMPTLAQSWFVIVFPGLALVLFALGWILVGDALRDALDPRLDDRKASTHRARPRSGARIAIWQHPRLHQRGRH